MKQFEIWKDIVGYEGSYQVSYYGNILSLKFNKKKLLNPGLNTNGYYQIALSLEGKKRRYLVSRLVALAFIPNPKNKRTVNHINGIPTDNRVINLEWATYGENIHHAFQLGLQKSRNGKDNCLSKSVIQYSLDNKIIDKYESQTDAAKSTGIYRKSISSACVGRYKTAGGYVWKFA